MLQETQSMSSASRYLEPVDGEDNSIDVLVDLKWIGTQDADDELSRQHEQLCLKRDGTFTHSLERRHLEGSATQVASGTWKLFKVRHLGADISAAADLQIVFTKAAGGAPLIADRLVVCGQNIRVNGFLGHACRLYPETSSRARRPVEVEAAEAAEAEPSTEEICLLAEATGKSKDLCLAALLEQHSLSGPARLEAAAARLFGEAEEAADNEPRQEDVTSLVEITGLSEEECRQSLKTHGSVVTAAEELLNSASNPGEELRASASSSRVLESDLEPAESASPSRTDAKILADMTGKPMEEIDAALKRFNYQADAAAAYLLGFQEGGSQADDIDVLQAQEQGVEQSEEVEEAEELEDVEEEELIEDVDEGKEGAKVEKLDERGEKLIEAEVGSEVELGGEGAEVNAFGALESHAGVPPELDPNEGEDPPGPAAKRQRVGQEAPEDG